MHIGSQLGDYRILEPIGSGGMGIVYLAEHVHLRKQYALKVLPEELAKDSGFVARFHDEARVMADLVHPHIVQVHYMGHADGVHYLVMDYVTGPRGRPESLHGYLGEQPNGRLAVRQTRTWAIQITEALAYAHRRGVVHRDIKPANILIDANGDVRLTDFGIAKAIGREFILSQVHQSMQGSLSSQATHMARKEGDAGGTLDGAATGRAERRSSAASSLLGTYDYMAPEQRGEGGGRIDQRTDLYSFGVLVYRMLTGKRPAGLAKPPSQVVEGVSRGWDLIVTRCLNESPDERYPDADALLEDIRTVEDEGRASSAATAVSETEQPEADAATSAESDLATIRASYILKKEEAADVLNAWSSAHRWYLWPICDHAKIEEVANGEVFHVEMKGLAESRHLEHETVAYSPELARAVRAFEADVESLPFAVPTGFTESVETRRFPSPDAVIECTNCGGKGKSACPVCRGSGERGETCPKCHGARRLNALVESTCSICGGHGRGAAGECQGCEGTGLVIDYQNVPCPSCRGTGRVVHDCATCKGEGSRPCGTCGGSGKLVRYPKVVCRFSASANEFDSTAEGMEPTFSRLSGAFLNEVVSTDPTRLALPPQLPPGVSRRIRAVHETFVRSLPGRVHRTSVTISYAPYADCRLKYSGRSFRLVVTGVHRDVIVPEWAPRNVRRITGACLGGVLTVLSGAFVFVACKLVEHELVPGPSGLVLVAFACLTLAGAVAYLSWAFFSRPAARGVKEEEAPTAPATAAGEQPKASPEEKGRPGKPARKGKS